MTKPIFKALRQPVTYRRRLSIESAVALEQFGSLLAETLWAWNRTNSILLSLFCSIMDDKGQNDEVAKAIWHSFKSDSAQIEMLSAVSLAKFGKSSEKYKSIKWIVDNLTNIGRYRNYIVHAPLIFVQTKPGRPNHIAIDPIGAMDRTYKRLSAAGSKKRFWKAIFGDLMVISQFALAISGRARSLPPALFSTSLKKPRLQTPQEFARVDELLNPQQLAPKRRPPHGKPHRKSK